jgi:hypothetical protein
MSEERTAGNETPRTVRLVFSYGDDKIELVGQETVEMTPFPSEPTDEQLDFAGFWYELQDAEGRTLYRRVEESPLKGAVEVFSGDPQRPLQWQEIEQPQGFFVLFVPHIDEAQSVVLFSSSLDETTASPFDREAVAAPARAIAQFPLT